MRAHTMKEVTRPRSSRPNTVPPYMSLAKKLVKPANFTSKDSYRYELEEVASIIKHMKGQPSTMKELAENPDLEDLDLYAKYSLVAKALAGPSFKSPHKKFISNYLKAFSNHFAPEEDESPLEIVYSCLSMRDDIQRGGVVSYNWLAYGDRIALHKERPYYTIKKEFSKEEISYIIHSLKSLLIATFKKYLSKKYIERAILQELREENEKFKDVSDLSKNFPEFYKYLLDKVLEAKYRLHLENMKVETSNLQSENSDVYSSSFSTYYYEDFKIEYDGKTFMAKRVPTSTSYYSGGWN